MARTAGQAREVTCSHLSFAHSGLTSEHVFPDPDQEYDDAGRGSNLGDGMSRGRDPHLTGIFTESPHTVVSHLILWNHKTCKVSQGFQDLGLASSVACFLQNL